MRLIPQPLANRRFKAGRAVAEEQRVFARRLHAVKEQRQLFHRVFRQALAAPKNRAVNLLGARVENRADHAVKRRHVRGQRFKRVHRDAGLIRRVRQRLHRGNADAHAGERAGADHRAEYVHIRRRHVAHLQRRIHHRHNALAVRLPVRQFRLVDQPAVGHDGHAACRAGCVNHQDVHRLPPASA